MSRGERILVALSGGVDSSVAAALLREQGHDVVGVTLHLWDARGESQVGRCCAPEDRDDARRTCDALGIPHYVLDEREAFRAHVVDPFVEAYAAGRTPLPCAECNRTVKLVHLVEVARRLGCERVATGHYARIDRSGGRPRLLRGRDHHKDQSYFLFGLPPETLDRLLFPLGDAVKDETREHARRLGLPNADKPDSQELCFVPDGDVGAFLRREGVPARPGRVVTADGGTVGEREDVHGLTIGQRRGLGLGGGPARYVLRVLPDEGRVVVGPEDALLADELSVDAASWLGEPPSAPLRAAVRIRYRHAPADALVEPRAGGFRVHFDAPQRAITPGQAAVVYSGEEVLGGGFIA